MSGVFEAYEAEAWPLWFRGTLNASHIAGGIPQDPKVVESWIRAKMKDIRTPDEVQEIIAKTIAETGISTDEAISKVATEGTGVVGVNGFKRDAKGLYVEGRQLKAALKEAVSVAVAAGLVEAQGWGSTRKWLTNFFPEHVFVVDEVLYLMRNGAHVETYDGQTQKFVHTWRGDSISYEQYCKDVDIHFTVKTDFPFRERDWAMIWQKGQMQGFGASRSQEYGRYIVTEWTAVPPPGATRVPEIRAKAGGRKPKATDGA